MRQLVIDLLNPNLVNFLKKRVFRRSPSSFFFGCAGVLLSVFLRISVKHNINCVWLEWEYQACKPNPLYWLLFFLFHFILLSHFHTCVLERRVLAKRSPHDAVFGTHVRLFCIRLLFLLVEGLQCADLHSQRDFWFIKRAHCYISRQKGFLIREATEQWQTQV